MNGTQEATTVGTPDADWGVAKLRMEFAFHEATVKGLKAMATAINSIYTYGERNPEVRPVIISMVGADRD